MENIKMIISLAEIGCFAAIIAACSVFVLPLGPVPITLQTMAVALTGMLAGPRRGVLAVLLYILAGVVGAPVFAGGRAGMGVLFSPTGGYLAGFACMAALCGKTKFGQHPWKTSFWLLMGLCALHGCGIIGLRLSLGDSWMQAFLIDAAFIPGDLLKSFAAFLIWHLLTRNKKHDRRA